MPDPVKDILKQFENQTHSKTKTYTNNVQLNNVSIGNSTSDTWRGSTQHHTRNNHNHRRITVNNGQKDSVNSMSLNDNIKEPNEKSGNHTRTFYRSIIRNQTD